LDILFAKALGTLLLDIASSIFLFAPLQALFAQGFTPNVVGDVAFVEVQAGSEIQPAFDFLETYIDANSSVNSGVVDLTSSTTFAEVIDAHDNTTLNIQDGVTLTIDSAEVMHRGIDLSNTTNSGVTGGGVLDVNEKAQFGIYGEALHNPIVGNLTGVSPLEIIDWRTAVGFFSTPAVASSNIEIENLHLHSPCILRPVQML